MNDLFTLFNLRDNFASETFINDYIEHININSNNSNNIYNCSYSEQNSSFIERLNSSSIYGINVIIINSIIKIKKPLKGKRGMTSREKRIKLLKERIKLYMKDIRKNFIKDKKKNFIKENRKFFSKEKKRNNEKFVHKIFYVLNVILALKIFTPFKL